MLSSPNAIWSIYNGTQAAQGIQKASEQITLAFTDYFTLMEQPYAVCGLLLTVFSLFVCLSVSFYPLFPLFGLFLFIAVA